MPGALLAQSKGKLVIISPSGRVLRRYGLGSVIASYGATASPDGSWIALIGRRRGGPQLGPDGLFLLSSLGGAPRTLQPPGSGVRWYVEPVWSPDGSLLAFAKGGAKHWIADMRSDSPGSAFEIDVSLIGGPVFTPDGQALVGDTSLPPAGGQYNQRQLVRVPVTRSPLAQLLGRSALTPPSSVQVLNPRFSPDGGRIASFSHESQGEARLWVGPVGGARQPIATAPRGHRWGESLAWSPDGRSLAVVWGRSEPATSGLDIVRGTLEIISADGRSRHRARVRANAANDRVTWSPDSRFVAFAAAGGGSVIAARDGRVWRGRLARFNDPQWLSQAPRLDRYVALGDSYSSGVGTRAYDPSSGACLRGPLAYPSLIAQERRRTLLSFSACAGATTLDVVQKQASALTHRTTLVSISIGGNDAGFEAVLRECAEPSLLGSDRCHGMITAAQRFIRRRLPSRLALVFRTIKRRSPRAKVAVAGYPRLFGDEDCNALTFFHASERRRLNETADLLASVTRHAASRFRRFHFVDPRSAFLGHAVCDPEAWLNGLSEPRDESFHPNAAGSRAYADLVRRVFG